MFKISETTNEIDFKFSSDTRFINRVLDNKNDLFEDGFDLSGLDLILRELIANAIEHGNKNNSTKNIECSISLIENNFMKIIITDEGDGFDWKKINYIIPDISSNRSRGFPIINSLCDKIEFSEKGNQVTAFFKLVNKTDFKYSIKDNIAIITPSGDITAENSNELKTLLKTMYNDEVLDFEFDLINVEEIDSLGLSVLLILANIVKDKNRLKITNVNNALTALFKMMRFNRLYQIIEKE